MSSSELSSSDPLPSAAAAIEYVPKDFFQPLPLGQMFPPGPLELDLGCGEGAFLAAIAERHPERNFLGIERLLGRVRNVCRIVAHRRLTNVRLMRVENQYLVEHLLPPNSVEAAYVLFPDPWPKRYHHPRRLIQEKFLEALHSKLTVGGELRVKTDDQPYFLWMEKVFQNVQGYERLEWVQPADYPVTNFERRFLSQGLPIYSAIMRKI